MLTWRRFTRGCLVVALVVGSAGLGVRAAGAAASVPAPSLPRPSLDMGAVPTTPAGCGIASQVLTSPAGSHAIPDATIGGGPGVLTSVLTPTALSGSVYLWDVNVSADITHTFSGDLEITLISPHGTRVTLSRKDGGSLDNIYHSVIFDDQAGLGVPPGPVTMVPYVNNVGLGLVNPQEPLAALNGENPNGPWTLEVRDLVHGDSGVLLSWALQLTALTSVPQVIPFQAAGGSGPLAIPDGHGQLDVAMNMFSTLPMSALTLTTVITHPSAHDLVISLVTPAGVTLTVSNRNPITPTTIQSYANVFAGTTFYDGAGAQNPPGPLTDNDYLSGHLETPLAPQEGFAEINGRDNHGLWHLILSDVMTGSAGTLGSARLNAAALTCEPALSVGTGGNNFHNRLGQPVQIFYHVSNLGTTASNVLFTGGAQGPYGFRTLDAPGWSCATPAVGALSPGLNCVRNSLPPSEGVITLTLTAPAIPQPAAISGSLSSNPPGLFPPFNGPGALITAYGQSANGNPWDVLDALNTAFGFPPDSGAVQSGGQNTFFGFGQIQVRVLDQGGALLSDNTAHNMQLAYAPGHRWSGADAFAGVGVSVRRDLLAPAGADWLRYVDQFTNNGAAAVQVWVSWGGQLGSFGQTRTAATSSGDLTLNTGDQWGVTFDQNAPSGPAVHPPVGLAFRSAGDSSYAGPYVFSTSPFTKTAWPSLGNGSEGQVFHFTLDSGQTKALAYFVARGLTEGVPGPEGCEFFGGCVTPAAGSQVAIIESTVAALAANPPFCDLSPVVLGELTNWPQVHLHCLEMPLVLR